MLVIPYIKGPVEILIMFMSWKLETFYSTSGFSYFVVLLIVDVGFIGADIFSLLILLSFLQMDDNLIFILSEVSCDD